MDGRFERARPIPVGATLSLKPCNFRSRVLNCLLDLGEVQHIPCDFGVRAEVKVIHAVFVVLHPSDLKKPSSKKVAPAHVVHIGGSPARVLSCACVIVWLVWVWDPGLDNGFGGIYDFLIDFANRLF